MNRGGQTLEELETLMEDAFVLRDGQALADLFEDRGVLHSDDGTEMSGREAIALGAEQAWAAVERFITAPRRVFQSRDTALLIGEGGVNVARRGYDRSWRLAISLLSVEVVEAAAHKQSMEGGG